MSLLQTLENGLFAFGQILRLPVIALLWGCVLVALYLAGSCIVDTLARRRERRGFRIEGWLQSGSALGSEAERLERLPAVLRGLLGAVEQARDEERLDDGGLEHLLLQREEELSRSLRTSRLLVRVGPSLGLLGTLIPMGASLAAMAAGDLEAMAGQMVVAFTTTIVGLACGTLAFVILTVRQGWIRELTREQRFLMERVAMELEGAAEPVEPTHAGAGEES